MVRALCNPLFLNGLLIFSRLDFLQLHVVIARFAEMYGKIECRQGFVCEGASPASNGGRGLKPSMCMAVAAPDYGIARQQWRARIETTPSVKHIAHLRASPASNGGRGLKQVEIWMGDPPHPASPASNGGRGLKHRPIRYKMLSQ